MESYFGYIFIPSTEGTKRIDGVRLLIDGNDFSIELSIRLFGNEQYNFLTGAFTGLGYVSLLECNVKNTSNGISGFEGHLKVRYLIVGLQINTEDQLYFSRMTVAMPTMRKWVNKSIFKSHLFTDHEMKVEYPETIDLGSFEDFKLEAYFRLNQSIDSENTITLKDYIVLRIESLNGNLSLWRFLHIYRKYKKFLAFIGVFNNNNDTITLFENSIRYEEYDGPVAMKFYSKSYNFKNNGIDNVEIPKFVDVEPNLRNILSKWFSSNEFADSVDLILEKYFLTGLSRETFFLNSCFAIEIFHRRFRKNEKISKQEFNKIKKGIISKLETTEEKSLFVDKLVYANEPTFRDRLQSFKDDLGLITPEDVCVEDYIKLIVNTRNFIVHRSATKETLVEIEIYYAAVHLETLTKLCIYRELGFNDEILKKMFIYTRDKTFGMFQLNKRLQKGIRK